MDRDTIARPPRRVLPPPPTTPKHLIAESSCRAETVTCVCGWFGSTHSDDGRTSDWSRHVAVNRAVRA